MLCPHLCPHEPFVDPLSDYESADYGDAAAQRLADASVAALESTPFHCVSADTSVRDTMKMMVGNEIACVLVEDRGKLAGVFTDRDVLDKVALEYDDVVDLTVRSLMATEPIFVHEEDSAARVITVMAVSGYRHVPVVDHDGAPAGIVSPQRVVRFLATDL